MTPAIRSVVLMILAAAVAMGWMPQDVAEQVAEHTTALLVAVLALWSLTAGLRARKASAEAEPVPVPVEVDG
jgi:hypothetical protein